jgi:hypothetical protein
VENGSIDGVDGFNTRQEYDQDLYGINQLF